MNEIELVFAIFLKPTDNTLFFNQDEHHNLLFHKWLPNGETDCINLFCDDEDISINISFERRIDQDGSYSVHSEELEDSSLSNILKIESGPMVVKISAQNLTNEQFNAFKNTLWNDFSQNFEFSEQITSCRNRSDLIKSMGSEQNRISFLKFSQTEEFKIISKFAKDLAKKFYQPLSNLIQFIKYNFGQYWIADFAHFDSRKGNLGAYFFDLSTKWRFKGSKKWLEFIIEPPLWDFWAPKVDIEVYSRYITKNDWEKLKKIKIHDYTLIFSLKRLIDAHKHWEIRNYDEAFVYLCNALDLSIDVFFKELHPDFSSSVQSFRSLPWINKLPLITSNLVKNGKISGEDLKKGLDAIKIRNKIVHEKFSLNNSEDISKHEEMYNKLKMIVQLLIENQPKFPIWNI